MRFMQTIDVLFYPLLLVTFLVIFLFLQIPSIGTESTGDFKLYGQREQIICPPGYIIDKNGFCDPDTTSNIQDNNLVNETKIPDTNSNEKPITNSTEFEAILLAANGVPPVASSASAKAHFELKDNSAELTVPTFSLEGMELQGIIAVHIHAGNNTENGPIILALREYNGSGVDAWEEQLIASGPIKPENFEGPLRGQTIADLIDLINEGRAYVDIHTNLWPIPELRGTISPIITNATSGTTELQSAGDLRKLGYDDGCLDARKGTVSSSLSEQSNTYRLGYKEGHDACSEEPLLSINENSIPKSAIPDESVASGRYYDGLDWSGICNNPLLSSYISKPCDILVTPDGKALTSEGKIALESILCPQGPSILSTIEQFYGSVPEHIKNELDAACVWSDGFNSNSEVLTPSEQPAPESYIQGGVDWMNTCQTVQVALYPSCDNLVNDDNSLTFEGERALGCIRNGAVLALGAGVLGVPWSIIPKGLELLAVPTGCGGVIKMDMLSQVGGLSDLLNILP